MVQLPDWRFCRQIPEMLRFLGLVGARKFIWRHGVFGALLPAEMCPLKIQLYSIVFYMMFLFPFHNLICYVAHLDLEFYVSWKPKLPL